MSARHVPVTLWVWEACAALAVLVIAVPGGPGFSGSRLFFIVFVVIALALLRRSRLAWWVATAWCVLTAPAIVAAISGGFEWDLATLGVLVAGGAAALLARPTRTWVAQ